MTTSSQLIPTFILLNIFSHTQLLSLMRPFGFPDFLSKLSSKRHKPLSVSVTNSPSYAENSAMAYLGFIIVPNYAAV